MSSPPLSPASPALVDILTIYYTITKGMVDVVTSEVECWKNIDKATIREFTDKEGLVNEFALMHKVYAAQSPLLLCCAPEMCGP